MSDEERYEMLFRYTKSYDIISSTVLWCVIVDSIAMLFVVPIWVFWQLENFSTLFKFLLFFPLAVLEYILFCSASVFLIVLIGYAILGVVQKRYINKLRREEK